MDENLIRWAENALGPYKNNHYRLPNGNVVSLVEAVARAMQDYGDDRAKHDDLISPQA